MELIRETIHILTKKGFDNILSEKKEYHARIHIEYKDKHLYWSYIPIRYFYMEVISINGKVKSEYYDNYKDDFKYYKALEMNITRALSLIYNYNKPKPH